MNKSDYIKKFEESLREGEFDYYDNGKFVGIEVEAITAFLSTTIDQIVESVPCGDLKDLESEVFCPCGEMKVASWEGETTCPTFNELDETDIASSKKWRDWYSKHDGAGKYADESDLRAYEIYKEIQDWKKQFNETT